MRVDLLFHTQCYGVVLMHLNTKLSAAKWCDSDRKEKKQRFTVVRDQVPF